MKTGKYIIAIAITIGIIVSSCTPQLPPSPDDLTTPPSDTLSNPKLVMAEVYKPTAIKLTPKSPDYSLPLSLDLTSNIGQVKEKLQLNSQQEAVLATNGFVVIPWQGDDVVQPYKDIKNREVPIFVTSDTLLHLYHIQFNEILKRIEEEEFFNQLVDMSLAMVQKAEEDYQSFTDAELKEAARRNVAYFTVALELLKTSSEKIDHSIPGYVKTEVKEELKNIEDHQGFKVSAIFNSPDSSNMYQEDYSQYVPRGHYTESEILKSYFKSMMWYGRMAFLLKGSDDPREALISEKDAKIATIQASLISAELPTVSTDIGTAKDVWDRIYSVTSFFVGTADDLTPFEYLTALKDIFGSSFPAEQLADETKLLELKAELAGMRNPQIYGGSGVCVILPPITKAKLYECLAKTKGLRFMGQRFVPDSYMFQNLVSPAVGLYTGTGTPFTMKPTAAGPARGLPRGLDIMAVLGSERAYDILKQEGDTDYAGDDTSYDKQLAQLREEFNSFDETDWHRNLYWAWLYALKSLIVEFGDGYPSFMQTDAWKDKELTTALASWTELRHDTILYAKQSYTPRLTAAPAPPKPLVGYIEPVPEFYARMLDLTTMTREGLSSLGALSQEEEDRLTSLENILDKALEIVKDELQDVELTAEDYDFIRDFGSRLESIIAGVESKGKETTLVADVHTDTNDPPEVLEEGVGYVDLILVAYKVPDGRIIIGAGPVLSYYEFKHPISDRLTDEQWKEMLESGQAPPGQAWTESYYRE
jgi:hypothetical protein